MFCKVMRPSLFLCVLLTLPAQATIVTLADYRLGDFDSGSVSGNAANSTIVDGSGNGNL
jgi:hypothetical protein